ncbi:MAG: UDP-glucose 4-epimerase GalE [Planctomycetota bacterium]|nr:UDP-glucose 4-epimerase GalE [Planctomycetota bacterium]
MAILVPGGAGYIGSHIVHELLDRGEEVVVADNLQTGHRAAVHPDAEFYQGDIRDRAFLDSLFGRKRFVAVVHFAANSLVGESVRNPLKYYDNNLGGAIALLDVMLRHGVHHIVFSSSAAAYGEPENIPILEDDRTLPVNPYGETKLAVEKLLRWLSRATPLRHAALRYFNAAGAHSRGDIGEDHSPETHLIPLVLQVANGKCADIGIFGDDYPTPDGTCVRDYIHVADLADAHIRAMRHLASGGSGGVFNLGNGVGFSVREVVEKARKVTGHPIPARIRPGRKGDPAQLVASNAKSERELGFKPSHSGLEEIIASAWNWHKRHPNGFAG